MIQFSHFSRTDVGLVRSANEDNLGDLQTPNGHVFTVCDGMGGHVGGATASKIAIQSILEYFNKQVYDNLMVAIDRALIFANEQIFAAAQNDPSLKGMGTTAVILIIKENECFLGHVGDSRIYLKSDNSLYRLTKDHSFVQTLVDQGIIKDEDAENHPKKNQILKALGIGPLVEPTVAPGPTNVKQGDVFMLCSDGLSGMVNDSSLQMMVDYNNLEMSANNLVNAALANGGHDNITVTLVGILDSPHATSEFTDFNPKETRSEFENLNNTNETIQKSKKNNKRLLMISAALILVISGLLFSYLYLYKTPTPIIPKRDVCKFCVDVRKQAPAMDSTELSNYLNKKVNIKSDTLACKKCRIVINDSMFIKIIPSLESNSSANPTNLNDPKKPQSTQTKITKKTPPTEENSAPTSESNQ
jgi:serine/threonine protein phosphatase PrpC